ncbi:MAG: glycosyltransferase, partial [Halobacteriovoraceae bacterium]|nr:glycosyltransferase [Halobacteriovoraceae bacterium]
FYSLFGKIFKKKVIITDHNGGGINYNKHLKIQKLIDINFHTSNISKEDASVKFANNKRIFGGVNTEIYRPIDSIERKYDFLFVGRLHPIKGIDLLVEASKKCQKPHSLTLAISSNSIDDQKRLLAEVGDNPSIKVIFNESKEELVKLYNSHRWVCLSSKNAEGRENLGLTVLEGLACGAKAACSPHCGVKEMKEEYPTSDMIVVENWDSFFEEFAGKEQKSNSVEWIKKNGTWDQVALRLFNNL